MIVKLKGKALQMYQTMDSASGPLGEALPYVWQRLSEYRLDRQPVQTKPGRRGTEHFQTPLGHSISLAVERSWDKVLRVTDILVQ